MFMFVIVVVFVFIYSDANQKSNLVCMQMSLKRFVSAINWFFCAVFFLEIFRLIYCWKVKKKVFAVINLDDWNLQSLVLMSYLSMMQRYRLSWEHLVIYCERWTFAIQCSLAWTKISTKLTNPSISTKNATIICDFQFTSI